MDDPVVPKQNSLYVYLLAILVTILVSGLTTFLIETYFSPKTTPIPSQKTAPVTSASDMPSPVQMTFKETLNTYCLPNKKTENVVVNEIDLRYLPLFFDPAVVPPGIVPCLSSSDGTDYYTVIIPYGEYTNTQLFHIYTKTSQELAHGGFRSIGPLAEILGEESGIVWSLGLTFSDVGPTPVGELSAYLRGEKKLILKNGEELLVNTYAKAVDGKDARLLKVLEKYSRPITTTESELIGETTTKHVYDGATKSMLTDVRNAFFANLSNLQSSEKQTFTTLIKDLGALRSSE